jgi:hypothetical protein
MQENTVYHYTSLETFAKIINDATNENLKFRATHIDFLNDFTEHTIAISLLKEKLIEYDNCLDKKDSKDFQTKLNDKRMSFFRYEEIDDLYPYIISFSECWDSLPMWKTYGNKSKGIALGFDKYKLSQIQEFKFEKCVYNSNEYEEYLNQNIKQFHSCLHINSYSIGFISGSESELLNQHYKYLPILKNKSYNYEDEYRLIIPSKFDEIEHIKFQASETLLKPYKEVLIPFEYLTEIVLGPALNLEKLKTSLGSFLYQKNKLISLDKDDGKIQLKKSSIPFREI